ncbi:hypothetical protein Hanom_Chr13g01218471 [Helianthus anomalus]
MKIGGDEKVMFALDFIKSDDTSDVVFADAASAEGEDVVVRGSERFEGSDYVSVLNVKGFVKAPVSKQSTRRSTRRKVGKDVKEIGKKVGGSKPSTKAIESSYNVDSGEIYVVTYFLHSSDINSSLGDVYSKLFIHGRHQGYTAGYDVGAAGSPKDKSPLFHPGAFEVFKNTFVKMDRLTYPYVGEVSECYGKPLSVLQGLKP